MALKCDVMTPNDTETDGNITMADTACSVIRVLAVRVYP